MNNYNIFIYTLSNFRYIILLLFNIRCSHARRIVLLLLPLILYCGLLGCYHFNIRVRPVNEKRWLHHDSRLHQLLLVVCKFCSTIWYHRIDYGLWVKPPIMMMWYINITVITNLFLQIIDCYHTDYSIDIWTTCSAVHGSFPYFITFMIYILCFSEQFPLFLFLASIINHYYYYYF